MGSEETSKNMVGWILQPSINPFTYTTMPIDGFVVFHGSVQMLLLLQIVADYLPVVAIPRCTMYDNCFIGIDVAFSWGLALWDRRTAHPHTAAFWRAPGKSYVCIKTTVAARSRSHHHQGEGVVTQRPTS